MCVYLTSSSSTSDLNTLQVYYDTLISTPISTLLSGKTIGSDTVASIDVSPAETYVYMVYNQYAYMILGSNIYQNNVTASTVFAVSSTNKVFSKVLAHPIEEDIAYLCATDGIWVYTPSTRLLNSEPLIANSGCFNMWIAPSGNYLTVDTTGNQSYQLLTITDINSVPVTPIAVTQKIFGMATLNNVDYFIRGDTSTKILNLSNVQNNSNTAFEVVAVTTINELTSASLNLDSMFLVTVFNTGYSVFDVSSQAVVTTKNANMTNVMVNVDKETEFLVQIQGNNITLLNMTTNFSQSYQMSSVTTQGFYFPSATSLTRSWLLCFPKSNTNSAAPTNFVVLQKVKNIVAPTDASRILTGYDINTFDQNDMYVIVGNNTQRSVTLYRLNTKTNSFVNSQMLQSNTTTNPVIAASLNPDNNYLYLAYTNSVQVYKVNQNTNLYEPYKLVSLSFTVLYIGVDYEGNFFMISNATNNLNLYNLANFNEGTADVSAVGSYTMTLEAPIVWFKYRKNVFLYKSNNIYALRKDPSTNRLLYAKIVSIADNVTYYGLDELGSYIWYLSSSNELKYVTTSNGFISSNNISAPVAQPSGGAFSHNNQYFYLGTQYNQVIVYTVDPTAAQLFVYYTSFKLSSPSVSVLATDSTSSFVLASYGNYLQSIQTNDMGLHYRPFYAAQSYNLCPNASQSLGWIKCSNANFIPLSASNNFTISSTINANGYYPISCGVANINEGVINCGLSSFTLNIASSFSVTDSESVMSLAQDATMVTLNNQWMCYESTESADYYVSFGNLIEAQTALTQNVYTLSLDCNTPPSYNTITQFVVPYGVGSFCQTYNTATIDVASPAPICQICKSGYTLYNDYCVQAVDNCEEYTKWSCTKCASGFYIKNEVCNPIPANCNPATFDVTNDTCTSCVASYSLYTLDSGDKKCFQDVCAPNLTTGICASCSGEYLVNTSGECQEKAKNCATFLNANCTLCETNYYLQGELCYKNPTHCTDVLVTETSANVFTAACTTCKNYYYLQSSTNNCVGSPIANCYNYDEISGDCLICKSDYTYLDSECVLRDSLNCFIYINGECTDLIYFFVFLYATFIVFLSIIAFSYRALTYFPAPRNYKPDIRKETNMHIADTDVKQKPVEYEIYDNNQSGNGHMHTNRIDFNSTNMNNTMSQTHLHRNKHDLDQLETSNYLTYAPNKAIMAYWSRKLLKGSQIAKYFINVDRPTYIASILLNIFVIILPGFNIVYLMWMIVDAIRYENDYQENKNHFIDYATSKMRVIYDDFHSIINKSVEHMNKNILLNYQPQVFDANLIRKFGFMECFTGFIVYEDKEYEYGLNRIMLTKEFHKYFEVPANRKGSVINVIMDSEYYDLKPSREEMKVHYYIEYKSITFDVYVLLVENQHFVSNYKMWIEQLVDQKYVSTHMTYAFGAGILNKSYISNQGTPTNRSIRTNRNNPDLNFVNNSNNKLEKEKKEYMSNEENIEIEFNYNDKWMKYDLIHLAIRKHLIKARYAIIELQKQILFDENDLSIVIYHSEKGKDVYELNINCEKSTILWNEIENSFEFIEQQKVKAEKYDVVILKYDKISLYYSMFEEHRFVINLVAIDEADLNLFITNYIRDNKWTKTLIDYYRLKQKRRNKIQRLETEISQEMDPHNNNTNKRDLLKESSNSRFKLEEDDHVLLKSQPFSTKKDSLPTKNDLILDENEKLKEYIKSLERKNSELSRANTPRGSNIKSSDKDQFNQNNPSRSTNIHKSLEKRDINYEIQDEDMSNNNNPFILGNSGKDQFNNMSKKKPIHNTIDALEKKLNAIDYSNHNTNLQTEQVDNEDDLNNYKSGVTDYLRQYHEEEDYKEKTFQEFITEYRDYTEIFYQGKLYYLFGRNSQNDADYNEDIYVRFEKNSKMERVEVKSTMNPKVRYSTYHCVDELNGKIYIYSGCFSSNNTTKLLTDVWEYSIKESCWRMLINFSESQETIDQLSERSENKDFKYIRVNPIFMKYQSDVILLGGYDTQKNVISDGLKMKIDTQEDNNYTIDIEIGYIRNILKSHSVTYDEGMYQISYSKGGKNYTYLTDCIKLNNRLLKLLPENTIKSMNLEDHQEMIHFVLIGEFDFINIRGLEGIICTYEQQNINAICVDLNEFDLRTEE